MPKEIILSLHPKWWEKIAAGEKRLEIRKSAPKIEGGVCGAFTCRAVHKFDAKHGLGGMDVERESCLTKEELVAYAANCPLYAWEIEDVQQLQIPEPLAWYGLKRPPQSWCYLPMQDVALE